VRGSTPARYHRLPVQVGLPLGPDLS